MKTSVTKHMEKLTEGLGAIPRRPRPGTKPTEEGAEGEAKRGPMPATSVLAHFNEDFRQTVAELDDLKKSLGSPVRIRLDLCDDGDHHASPLNVANVEYLKANLEANPQISPAVLERTDDGRYKIIAGRHRKAALLALGREDWLAVVRPRTDDLAAIKESFFDNLLARKLTDYETFLGFKRLRTEAGYSYEQLAKEANRPKTTIYRFFVFQELPEEVLETVAKHHELVSATLMEALQPFTEKKPAEVIAAIEQLAANPATTTAQLVAKLKEGTAPAKRPGSDEILVKVGKKPFAALSLKGNRVTVTLKGASVSDADAKELLKEVEQLVRQRAERAR